jgi:hypothetical protein
MAGKQARHVVSEDRWTRVRVPMAGRMRVYLGERHQANKNTDEPRRSGRATKGQHKNASSSPAPTPKPAAKGTAAKQTKKAAASQEAKEEEEEADEDVIRCVCGDDNEADKRAFVSCDACSVWQHNICMGVPEDEDEVGEHYFCEECRPEEHEETVESIKKGTKIWETRNKTYLAEKKMSKSRKSKSGKPSWLKKDLRGDSVATEEAKNTPTPAPDAKETSSKRKRESEVPSQETVEASVEEKPARGAPKDKKRKSSAAAKLASEDPDTAIVAIEKLPKERQNIAIALSRVIAESIADQVKAGAYRIPDGQTAKSLGDRHASKIEYALQMNHEGPAHKPYAAQFRMLHANLKQNRSLLLELLSGERTADSMATMQSSDMASDKLIQERAAIKAEADRHATIDQKEAGPRYRRTHKGDELVEDDSASTNSAPVSRPVRHSVSDAEMAAQSPTREGAPGSPTQPSQTPTAVDTSKAAAAVDERRASNRQFDVNTIWAKTAQSPTQSNAPRLMQVPPRRRSSVQHQNDGAKEDADVDRMLADDDDDDDDNYAPAEPTGEDSIVWRGKLVQSSGDSEPTVNARFVAGRDVSLTVPWKQMLSDKLNIDGRLQIQKAEEYLCGLQWGNSSDVSVLALTPYDDASAFTQFFEYFASRQRYAVVNKDKPTLVKDLYIIPIEPGGKIPDHIDLLEHCTIKRPVEERLLLATFVVARAANDTPTPSTQPLPVPNQQDTPSQPPQSTNGHHLPQHLRNSIAGPQGSPLPPTGQHFSPGPNMSGSPFPPNSYNAPPSHQMPTSNTPPNYAQHPHQQQQQQHYPPPHMQPHAPAYQAPPPPQPAPIMNSLANQILGDLQFCPSAQQVLTADPQIGEDKLQNLKRILVEDEGARTDIGVLATKLGASGGA